MEDVRRQLLTNIQEIKQLDEALASTVRWAYEKGLADRLPESGRVWINKKKGTRYTLLALSTDCTNERDGNIMVVYCVVGNPDKVFVRELSEFNMKFYEEKE